MWTMFSDAGAVADTVRQQRDHLLDTLARVHDAREYTVRVFTDPVRFAAALSTLSPLLSDLERRIATATPGQAYLLRRKLDEARRDEALRMQRTIADLMYDALAPYTADAVRDPLPRRDGAGDAILNASFLVRTEQYDDFRHALTELIAQYDPAGFVINFTGPWPPYHFVR
jgi:hypothetical protein